MSYRGRDDDDNRGVDCDKIRDGMWRCTGPKGTSRGSSKSDALDNYRDIRRPLFYPGPVYGVPVVPRMPFFRGGRYYYGGKGDDVDINIKNVYNNSSDDSDTVTAPSSGGRDVPVTPAAVAQASVGDGGAQGSFSLSGLPSWALPVGAVFGLLMLVMMMKK